MDLQALSTVELRQICYFVAIAEANNNFSRAAERLQMEQPPLSQRIRALEKRLNVELFDRSRRPLQLTAAGEVFLQEVQLALSALDHAIAQTQRAARGEIGHLSMGIISTVANTILPEILRTFRDRFPHVELELRELTAAQQLRDLRDRRLNVGFEVITPNTLLDSTIEALPILQEALLVALPVDHPLAGHEQLLLAQLMHEPLILPSLDSFPFYNQFIFRCQAAGFQPKIVQTAKATWMMTLYSLVAAGLGLAILPMSAQNLQRTGVVCRPIWDINLTRQISVLWRKDDPSDTLREFLAVVREVAALPPSANGV